MTKDQRRQDTQRRIEIIFGEELCNPSFILFDNLSIEKFNLLIEESLIDLEDSQNDSPTAGEFYNFISLPLWRGELCCNGYIIGDPQREDCRVSITGLEFHKPTGGKVTLEQIICFTTFAKHASEIEVSATDLYCWWD